MYPNRCISLSDPGYNYIAAAGAEGVMLPSQLCVHGLGSCAHVAAGIIADTGRRHIRRFAEKPQYSQPFRKTPLMKFYRNRHKNCQKHHERSDIHHNRIVASTLKGVPAQVGYICQWRYRCQRLPPWWQFLHRDEYAAYEDQREFYHCG